MSITVLGDINQFTKLHLEVQGGLVAVKREFRPVEQARHGGARGVVTEFSPASRKRLMRKTARLAAGRATFLTLTYPARFPGGAKAKTHLRAFLERVRRRWPDVSGVWRLEYQERGAPHFHLILYDMPFVPFWMLRRWWAEIIQEYVDFQLPFIRINYLLNDRQVKRYVSKYVAKAEDEKRAAGRLFNNGSYLHAGRFWGVFNAPRLPFAPQVWVTLEQVTDLALERILGRLRREWDGIDPTWPHGVCVFSDYAYLAWLDCLVIAREDLPLAHSSIEVTHEKQVRRASIALPGPTQDQSNYGVHLVRRTRVGRYARTHKDARNSV